MGYSTWTPTFLKDKYPEMTLKAAALHSVLWHYAGAAIGVMIGSRVADRFAKTRKSIRLEVTVFGILGSIPSIILMVKAPTLAVCCGALFAWLYGAAIVLIFISKAFFLKRDYEG